MNKINVFARVVKRFESPKALYKFPIIMIMMMIMMMIIIIIFGFGHYKEEQLTTNPWHAILSTRLVLKRHANEMGVFIDRK